MGGEESKTISEVGNLEINYKVNQNKYDIIRNQENINDVINKDKLPDWLKIN